MARKRRQRQDVTALCFDKRGRLLSVGRNSYSVTHPLQAEYGQRTGRPNAIFLHAELQALLRARDRKVYKIVVTRINKHGQPVLAKPCPSCALAIKEWGVREVVHT